MFGIGVPELILILALALIVLGPDKLPQVAKQIARFVGELKRASEDFKKQLDVEGLEDIKELKEMADLKNPQTWKKNFDRLVDLDSLDAKPHPLAESGDRETDLPGGLGPEWKEAEGPGSKDADKADSHLSSGTSDASGTASNSDNGTGISETSEPRSEMDVINPRIDYSALEETAAQGEEEQDSSPDSVKKQK